MDKKTRQLSLLERIAEDILCGEFRPRERLVETDLMQKYGATRNAVRNAFKELAARKLIVHQPNRGVAVAEVSQKDAIDLYKLRVLLESYTARQVMRHLSPAQLQELRAQQAAFIEAAQKHDFRGMSQANNRFHELTFQASQNQTASGLIMELRTRSNLLLYHVWSRPGQFEKSIQDHEDMLNALEQRDLDAFIRINTRHVLASLQVYVGKPLVELGLDQLEPSNFEPGSLLEVLSG